MDAETRKTLEAMAECEDGAAEEAEDFQGAIPLAEEFRRGAAAIRAALAEVDALTQQVATMTAENADLNAENDMLNARVISGAQQVADLEARAIPFILVEMVSKLNGEWTRIGAFDEEEDATAFMDVSRERWPSYTYRMRDTHPAIIAAAALSAAKETP